MVTLILEPEFFVDLDGTIRTESVVIEDGIIVAFGDNNRVGQKIVLNNQVLLAGFVNCHSHVFQRLLRGLVEKKSIGLDNFWTWREKMYAIVQKITKEDLGVIARYTYLEMLEAGYTNVAEFHYLHHDEPRNVNDPIGMSRALALAATDVGMNLTLLPCAYQRYDFTRGLSNQQRRFGYSDIHEFLSMVHHCKGELSSSGVDVGVAIHSVRAVFESSLSDVGVFAKQHNLALHVHASEQVGEVNDCIKAHDRSPISLLNEAQVLSPLTTLVHATHLIRDDVELIAGHDALVCICPSTEKNLGDGIPALSDLATRGVAICVGSDQNVRIDPFSEARSLEELERLRLQQRNVLGNPEEHLFQPLLSSLSWNALRSINQRGERRTLIGRPANLIGVKLPPEYEWYGPKAALDAILLSFGPAMVSTVLTRGQVVVHDGVHKSSEKSSLIYQIKDICKKFN